MLGLRLAPGRRSGRLRLVGMELRSMVWIGLVNSGCNGKEGDNAEHTRAQEAPKAGGRHTRTHHRGLGG
jgi:hypothetical protein